MQEYVRSGKYLEDERSEYEAGQSAAEGQEANMMRAFLMLHALGLPVVPDVKMKAAGEAIVRGGGTVIGSVLAVVGDGKGKTPGADSLGRNEPRFRVTVLTSSDSDLAALAAYGAMSGVLTINLDAPSLTQCSSVSSRR